MTVGIDASRANVVEKTGTEWYAYYIIRGLIQRHPEVHWILYSQTPLRPDLADLIGPTVESRVLRWRGPLWSHVRLSVEMLLRPPDLLFVPAHTIPLVAPRLTVTTIHDIGFERFPELYADRTLAGSRGRRRWFFEALVRAATFGHYGNREVDYHRFSLRRAIRAARRIITVSNFSARELQTVLNVAPERITVIPHGFSGEEVGPAVSRDELSRRFGLTRPYLLYVGRLEHKKGIVRLAAAYATLHEQQPDAPDLVLVGHPGFRWIDAQAKLNRVPAGRVHRLPWLAPTELSMLFQHAAAFIFPSAYEGFGLPLLLAFAHKTPVVISDQPALKEVAADAALVAQAADGAEGLTQAMTTLLTNASLRARLVAAGEQRLSDFRWETAVDATFRVFQEVGLRVASTGKN